MRVVALRRQQNIGLQVARSVRRLYALLKRQRFAGTQALHPFLRLPPQRRGQSHAPMLAQQTRLPQPVELRVVGVHDGARAIHAHHANGRLL